MIKRTLLFGNPAHLSTSKNQLVVKYPNADQKKTMPIEDIGVVLLEHPQITISHTLISKLLGNQAAIITCDAHHLPQGLMLNLNTHHKQVAQMSSQLAATDSLKGKLWKQTIKAKIRNQAALLKANGIPAENMEHWARKVQSGDPDNLEGRAAAYYWKSLFTDLIKNFKRGRFEGEPNNLLNYGYAILRASVSRSLMVSGLLPTIGYHHHNQYNSYCLADDVMEPYRPFVDQLVLELVRTEDNYAELTPALKQKLLQIPVLDVKINGLTSPLMTALQQTTSSLQKCYSKELKEIKFPAFEF
ncbi:type II CRISPR-associated endonuclease Cas1 [Roseivirga sp. UBA838]|uniref:type II CRISPR-associated endonuclease Cas1 n=1 Tax=Roseivirga sp. UBA838 TaxID=1947393 RepID=UPI00257E4796|nr:type II CRISPR-associated endonuclease Cas1 [Roseivirga sp. UBA838]|tara:strand:+ start:26602 stop:27504 length:903 start_codon:yes stop_codon:yes gene_type:complete